MKMKLYCLLFLAASVLAGCHVPADSPKMVEKIVEDDAYRIDYAYQGCFGGGTETLQVSTKKGSREATFIFMQGRGDGAHKQRKTIPWNAEKDNLVKDLFNKGIAVTDTTGLCTTHATFALVSTRGSVSFSDKNCDFGEKFETLKQ